MKVDAEGLAQVTWSIGSVHERGANKSYRVVVRRLKNSLLSCDTPGLALHVHRKFPNSGTVNAVSPCAGL
jgi:hypothetical protein